MELCILHQILHGNLTFPNTPVDRGHLPALNLLKLHTFFINIYKPAAHTNAYHFSFLPDAITNWNALPMSLQACNTLYDFRYGLNLITLFIHIQVHLLLCMFC